MYPVEVAYLHEPTPDYVRKAAEVTWNINLQVIIYFMPDDVLMQTGEVAGSWRYPSFHDWPGGYRSLLGRPCGIDSDVCRLVYVPVPNHPTFHNRLPRNALRLVPLALHAGLSTDEQLRVFEAAEPGTRKVIVSTNIAEASCLSGF
jgi:ATP-dependent RNA helicase DDX35